MKLTHSTFWPHTAFINLMSRRFGTDSCCFGKEEGVFEQAEKMKGLHFQTGAKYFTGEHQMWNSSVLPLGFPNYRFQLADETGERRGGAEKWKATGDFSHQAL